MQTNHEKIIILVMTILLLISMAMLGKEVALYTTSEKMIETKQPTVVIDPGHGAADSGKVGIDGSLEKDINLAIAMKVKMFLEAADVTVIMTREDDMGLYPESGDNKKVQDMKNRVSLINSSGADLTVSIHQNSYTDESVQGVQVFYYDGSEEGETLAGILQEQLITTLNPSKEREIKANDSYYLLTETNTPIAIVECGFLSNYEDAENLNDPWYQEKVAWGISMGILRYLKG
ncbi:MAG: N-acetylmuramoyl-L-alanine amidase [Eubacteriales bacterium]